MQNDAPKPTADVLRLITNNFTELVLAYDMDRKLVFVSPSVETLTGYTMEDLKKENFICWIHPDDHDRMMGFWDTLFQGKSFHEEEYRLVTRDGRVKWVVASWTPLLDESGNQVGVQGREFEITQRKLAETAVRHSEGRVRADQEHYRVLFENSPFPMWEEDFSEVKGYLDSLTAAGISDIPAYLRGHRQAVKECVSRVRILDVNQAARAFYGASSKEVLLAGLDRIFDESALEIFREEIASLSENPTSFKGEFAVHTLKGDERLVDMIVSIVESARHDWSRVMVSFFDITDRKRLEEQLVQSQKMESLGRLAGGIAHDFNNLLTVINGYTEWILGKMEPDNPFRGQLAEVRSAGQRGAELTQQLLAFSRKQIVRAGPLDLNALIRESQAVLDRVLGDDVCIVTRLAADLDPIVADRSQMHQVLMNLALNAREAMPGGGTLTIETCNVTNRSEVLLEVRDTGEGIDEKTRRHLFEPFFTTKKSSKNVGLGLAIVFGVVSHGGGRIEVESQPRAGAAFRIYMPRSTAEVEERAENADIDSSHRGAGIVLVVEDREDVRTLACHMLRELGYQTLAAASGSEALAIAKRLTHSVPLLLTDVVMPGLNGRELADQLHQIFPAMKTIFMSGYTNHVLSNADTARSRSRYLQKPFTLIQLAEALRQVTEAN